MVSRENDYLHLRRYYFMFNYSLEIQSKKKNKNP